MSPADAASSPLKDTQRQITEREVMDWMIQSHVFRDLNASDLRPFLQSLQVLNFKPMDEVISRGKYSAALYLVTAGRFLVLRPESPAVDPTTTEAELIELDTFKKGDCFGEYSLIDKKPASASVVAAESSQALKIPLAAFDTVLMSDYRIAKTVYHNLLLLLTARLRKSLKV
ncbi:MAG: cyclic nucleotide-binding domain-containing protein [Gammaproteobacteria bacterium]|nr:cyclic nucleotide-binding domain-containing protein [Gammaproteobacteria bacterium]